MFAALMIAVIGQVKPGDSIYVRPPGATGYDSPIQAVDRYRQPVRSYPAGTRPEEMQRSTTTWFQSRTRLEAVTTQTIDGETTVKVVDNGRTWWILSTDVSVLDDVSKKTVERDEMLKRIRPFCVTKPEHAAVNAAVGFGLDPLTMTAKEAERLTASQRKALSSVKARYLKTNKATGRQSRGSR